MLKYADTDWDWFFSSLAQSAAAIVAIFAGFVISRILASQAARSAQTEELERLGADAAHLKRQVASLNIPYYSTAWNKTELELARYNHKRREHELHDNWSEEAVLKEVNLSPFQPNDVHIALVRDAVEAQREADDKAHKRLVAEARANGGFAASISTDLSASIGAAEVYNEQIRLSKKRDLIDDAYRDAAHLASLVVNSLAACTRASKDSSATRRS